MPAQRALLIINDHADVAAAVGSGRLHVGQTDLPVAQARQILAPHQVLGRSNREYEQLAESKEMGADHVAFGAIYATTSKGVARNPQGPERVREAKAIAGDTPWSPSAASTWATWPRWWKRERTPSA